MYDEKPFWQSKTLWGIASFFLSLVLRKLNMEVTPEVEAAAVASLLQAAEHFSAAVGLVLTTWGRLSARHDLTIS